MSPDPPSRNAGVLSLTAILAWGIALLMLIPLSPPQAFSGGDKLCHVLAFAALVLPASLLAPRLLWGLVPVLVVYGVILEVLQPLVGRQGEVLDALADAGGLCLGVVLGRLAMRVRARVTVRDAAEPPRGGEASGARPREGA